jgi:putative ABC transport system permease protein
MLPRILRRDPALVAAATLTLALCIGANTTMFSLVNSILLRPLPYPGGDRICWISERIGADQTQTGLGPDYYSLREENHIFEDVGAFNTLAVNWTGIDKPEQLDAAQVTPSFFRVMGAQPKSGRYFADSETGSKAPAVAVVSYPLSRRLTGNTLTLDRRIYTVIGVMPQGFDYPQGTQVWIPLPMDDNRPRTAQSPLWVVDMVARLKPGVNEHERDAEMARLTQAIHAEYPKEFDAARFLQMMSLTAIPLQRRMTGDLRPALLVLTAAVGLVLLIACVNLANLLLARAAERRREFSIRLALGASPGRIVRQMLGESLLLAVPGGLAGIALAALAVSILNVAKPYVLVRYPAIALDLRTLVFTFAITLFTGLLFGLAPAVEQASRPALRSPGGLRHNLRRLLVGAELAVSLVLLIGAGLLARSFLKLAHADLGFPADHLLTLRVNLTHARYATAESQQRYYDDVIERLARLPYVRSAAVSQDMPLSGQVPWNTMVYEVPGRPAVPIAQRPSTHATVVSRDYFRTFGIPLRAGSLFDSSPDAIMVSEAFARRAFPTGDPVGHEIVLGPRSNIRWKIAGVVGNVRGGTLGAEPDPLIYRCVCQGGNRFLSVMRISVRTTEDPRLAIHDVESAFYAVDREQPVFDIKTMDERIGDALAPQRFQLVLIGSFAALAILLAAAGVYGVMSYLVSRRAREIGIRITLGARPEDIRRLVLHETALIVPFAIGAGVAGALALTRYAASLLYGITTLDAPAFLIAPLILALAVVAGSIAPANRAARVDPNSVLR